MTRVYGVDPLSNFLPFSHRFLGLSLSSADRMCFEGIPSGAGFLCHSVALSFTLDITFQRTLLFFGFEPLFGFPGFTLLQERERDNLLRLRTDLI